MKIVCAGCNKTLYLNVTEIIDFRNVWCSDCHNEDGGICKLDMDAYKLIPIPPSCEFIKIKHNDRDQKEYEAKIEEMRRAMDRGMLR